ncbi:glutathione S-transferase domain protein [Roseibium sp. TrichSKD4]|uniref:glutathione S-transferase family protein n=1 Tax=Roseibium sp. TrichSKD4 TaxID=744980 RepID=UPI0001E56746|nr:glutathione S-transferase family protein [Roseibium sp. TrichSKD4]EFO33669.1 glutathione S-transferase domain protein [Roseibium sp. TrichSKD4]
MLIVHGRITSINVQPITWCLTELGMQFQRLDVGGAFGGTDTAEYRAMNPLGLVPVLVDGENSLSESGTILRYVLRQYGNHPQDPMAAAQVERWGDMCRSHIYPHLLPVIFWQLFRTPADSRNHFAIKTAEANLKSAMAIIADLPKSPLLGGNEPNLADYQIGSLLYRYYEMEFERADLPALDAYYAALCELPAFRDNVMIDFQALKVPGA